MGAVVYCLAGRAVLIRAGTRCSCGWRGGLQVLLILFHAPVTAVGLTLVSIPTIILQKKIYFLEFFNLSLKTQKLIISLNELLLT